MKLCTCQIGNKLIRCFLAEFLGTFILLLVGLGSVAQSVLSRTDNGDFFSINASWGVGVTLGLYTSATISGGHLNPAVTLAMALFRKFPWRHVPVYFAAQYLSTFLTSCVVFLVYRDGINNMANGTQLVTGPNATAGVFATYPKPFVSNMTCFTDQIIGTAFLLLCISALTDENNNKIDKSLLPISIGSVVFVIGTAYGFNCGYAINPARDLGPRVFTLIAGWGTEVFSYRNYTWFWIPILGPHIGAIAGVLIYDTFIRVHWEHSETIEHRNPGMNMAGGMEVVQTSITT